MQLYRLTLRKPQLTSRASMLLMLPPPKFPWHASSGPAWRNLLRMPCPAKAIRLAKRGLLPTSVASVQRRSMLSSGLWKTTVSSPGLGVTIATELPSSSSVQRMPRFWKRCRNSNPCSRPNALSLHRAWRCTAKILATAEFVSRGLGSRMLMIPLTRCQRHHTLGQCFRRCGSRRLACIGKLPLLSMFWPFDHSTASVALMGSGNKQRAATKS